MHQKLSEAVKLYDKLLTAQLSHPPWRGAAAAAPPAQAPYSPQYQAPATYGQWSIPAQVNPSSPQVQHAQPSYFPPERQPNGDGYAQPAVYGAQPSQVAPSSEYAQYSQPSQPSGIASPPPVSVPQYTGYGAPVEAQVAPVQSPPPVAAPHSTAVYQPAPPPPSFASSGHVPSSPPAQPSLARHNSVSAYQLPSAASPAPYLARAKTVAAAHSPHQLQQLQQTSVPQPLPNFPIAPTAVPQGYQPAYAPPAPIEQEREALLIDL